MDRQQVREYLKRIGFDAEHATDELPKPSLELLDRLIELHQLNVPFEDLDPYKLKRPVSLNINDLYQKIVANQRGGYCFELNKLFELLLKTLGFDVWPSIGRNVRGSSGDIHDTLSPIMHRSEIVRIDGKLHGVDVGYGGPMPARSFPLGDGARIESYGQLFEVRKLDSAWWQIAYRKNGDAEAAAFLPVVNFMDSPAQEGDFELMSHWCCTHPSSPFLGNLICNRRLPDGNIYLRNTTLTRTIDGKKTVAELKEDQIPQVLKEEFGIEL